MQPFVLIAIGAIIGANARYAVSNWAAHRFGTGFPVGTLLVNVSGSLLLAALITATAALLGMDEEARLLAGTGFCGAYTTFSTFAYETLALARRGAVGHAVLNVVANVVLGLAAATAGVFIASRFVG